MVYERKGGLKCKTLKDHVPVSQIGGSTVMRIFKVTPKHKFNSDFSKFTGLKYEFKI